MAGSSTAQGAISGAASGASMGSFAGPWGMAIGAVAGGVLGGIMGSKKKKMKTPDFANASVYGYDMNGNLVTKASYTRDANGQYSLKMGELSGAEKAMRSNLSANIANLINTVGTSPDAFVRYAKELSASYTAQGQRQLDEQLTKRQQALDESLARRGLSGSRAAADLTSELQGQRLDAEQNLFDAAQRYGFNIQSALQQQAGSALSLLGGYQGQLTSQDMSYLQQALKAHEQGQAYENMKVGIANQNIASENAGWDSVFQSMSDAGSLLGYKFGQKGNASLGGSYKNLSDGLSQNIMNTAQEQAPWSSFNVSDVLAKR